MSKCSKLKRSLSRIKPMERVFWSFEFLSFGIVSYFVFRYSNFHQVRKKPLFVGPFQGLSSYHRSLPVVADFPTRRTKNLCFCRDAAGIPTAVSRVESPYHPQ